MAVAGGAMPALRVKLKDGVPVAEHSESRPLTAIQQDMEAAEVTLRSGLSVWVPSVQFEDLRRRMAPQGALVDVPKGKPTVKSVREWRADVETVADVQHAIWAHWMRYLFSQCIEEEDGCMIIPSAFVERWKRQCATDYADLTEKERDSDRDQAWKVLNALFGEASDG